MPAEAQGTVCSANTTDALQVQGRTFTNTGGTMTGEGMKNDETVAFILKSHLFKPDLSHIR